jgi:hypothetical protein
MGLDTVELVIRVEKEFDIEIPNADAARLVTVGDMHAYVVDALRRQGRSRAPIAFMRSYTTSSAISSASRQRR